MNPEHGSAHQQRRELKRVRAWYALGALLLIGVAIVSLMPVANTGVNDKFGHLLTYALLAGWFAVIARNVRVLCISLIALVGYGILIEWLQSLTSYRMAEMGDVVANALGCVIGGLFYRTPLNRVLQRLEERFAR